MKNEKTELECQECGKVFKRTITDKNMYTMRCPKCRSTDLLPTGYFGISKERSSLHLRNIEGYRQYREEEQ